ncbi:histidine kinase dimerization/phosphoacceptor domain -containing protein [Paraflavitalea sp. CAU 1676]|uniref:tetratricopeptide repeat-containing sensor histidine kinase n=1 Tax=Paraflavitalea sp. CAU 1676 TaxID=3032598 RepID=UPI0023DA727B|nr:histidine kinase dimerization/phosphoacceptor domain -containing protein [Paraflavitalea sp. CAU 1676]MDF2193533.1 histidine kinase dimerization/phosphoacceptor domain -containing protein [Paraflavitalea sp. CAU 1676]
MKKLVTFILLGFVALGARSQVKPAVANPLQSKLAETPTDTGRIRIYLQLADYYYRKNSVPARLDSMAYYLHQARQVNQTVKRVDFQNQAGILNAQLFCELHPDEDPTKIFTLVIDTCQKTGDALHEQRAWTELGDHLGNDAQTAGYKISCYEKAMALARKRNNGGDELDLLRYIADVHLQQRKFDLAEKELFQIIGNENKSPTVHIMYACDLLAALYVTKGAYDKALQYALKTEKMMHTTGDTTFAGTFYNRISQIYYYLGKLPESIEWQKKCLTNSIWTQNLAPVFSTIVGISNLHIKQGKPREALQFILDQTAHNKPVLTNDRRAIQKAMGDCYNLLKEYDKAEKCFAEAIRLGKEQRSNFSIFDKGADYYSMGQFYLRKGNYEQSRPFLDTALKVYAEGGVLQLLRNVHASLFQLDSATGNYLSAINHLQLSNRVNDSLFSIARNKQIEELTVAYQTEQKDQNIKVLEGKEKLAKAQLQYAENTRNWVVVGAVMLLVIAGLLYRQTRQRKKHNSLIAGKNEQLQRLVTEKEWLLKEVHHRVKNNLQIVMSLLNSQTAYIDNEPALRVIHDSQHRVHAMSLIHQKLYNTDDISSIDISSYIRELTLYLGDSYNTGQRIRFEFDIVPLDMDVSQAVPLGLILNEAITNSIKYAFPNDRQGVIAITLVKTAPQNYLLTIADNGIGMPGGQSGRRPGSLGMSLMEGLSEDLDGSFSIDNNGGTIVKVSFIHDENAKGHDRLTTPASSDN